MLPQEGAGRAQRTEPGSAAPLLIYPGPGHTDFGLFFESSPEKSFVRLDRSLTAGGGHNVSRAT